MANTVEENKKAVSGTTRLLIQPQGKVLPTVRERRHEEAYNIFGV